MGQADVAVVPLPTKSGGGRMAETGPDGICGRGPVPGLQGQKSACINALLKKGYCPDHVLMVGDAPGTVRQRGTTGYITIPSW